jgi:hypothetical protein
MMLQPTHQYENPRMILRAERRAQSAEHPASRANRIQDSQSVIAVLVCGPADADADACCLPARMA